MIAEIGINFMEIVMKTFAAIVGISLFFCPVVAVAQLQPGTIAPTLRAQGALSGHLVNVDLREALRKGPVVLYFYPAAFSAGCDLQAKEFSEAADRFKQAGATIIGMSSDPIDKLQKFSQEKCAGKFAVGAATPRVIRAYDVAFRAPPGLASDVLAQTVGRTNRTTYVIAPNGRIVFAYSNLSPRGHVDRALEAVQRWRAPKI